MTISEKLNDYISQNGIKQIHIAEKTGLSQDAVSRMLKGSRRILATEFLEICAALDLDPNLFRKKA